MSCLGSCLCVCLGGSPSKGNTTCHATVVVVVYLFVDFNLNGYLAIVGKNDICPDTPEEERKGEEGVDGHLLVGCQESSRLT